MDPTPSNFAKINVDAAMSMSGHRGYSGILS
jgi:hypothetical protein